MTHIKHISFIVLKIAVQSSIYFMYMSLIYCLKLLNVCSFHRMLWIWYTILLKCFSHFSYRIFHFFIFKFCEDLTDQIASTLISHSIEDESLSFSWQNDVAVVFVIVKKRLTWKIRETSWESCLVYILSIRKFYFMFYSLVIAT